MGMLYQVIEDKVDFLSENLEKGLRYIGKAMQCIDELKGGDEMGFRSGSSGYREDDDMDERMGMRRGRGGYRTMGRKPMMYREPFME